MAEVNLGAIINRSIRSLPQGKTYLPVHSLLSRVVEDLKLAESLVNKAECASKSMGSCTKEFCKVGCANLFYMKSEGKYSLWKIGTNAFSLEKDFKKFRVSSKNLRIEIDGRKFIVILPASEGSLTLESDLRDIKSLLKNHGIISYVLNKLEPLIRNALSNVNKCIRERRLGC